MPRLANSHIAQFAGHRTISYIAALGGSSSSICDVLPNSHTSHLPIVMLHFDNQKPDCACVPAFV